LLLTLFYNYKNNYYLESEEKFKNRIDKIKSKDGNHMLLITSLVEDRDRIKQNRSNKWYFK
jgi:hypothetical protein